MKRKKDKRKEISNYFYNIPDWKKVKKLGIK